MAKKVIKLSFFVICQLKVVNNYLPGVKFILGYSSLNACLL